MKCLVNSVEAKVTTSPESFSSAKDVYELMVVDAKAQGLRIDASMWEKSMTIFALNQPQGPRSTEKRKRTDTLTDEHKTVKRNEKSLHDVSENFKQVLCDSVQAKRDYLNKLPVAFDHKLCEVGGHVLILKLMEKHLDDVGIQVAALKIVQRVSDAGGYLSFGPSAVILAVKAMEAYPKHPAIQQHGCAALVNLAKTHGRETPITRQVFIDTCAHRFLAAAIENVHHKEVHRNACFALAVIGAGNDQLQLMYARDKVHLSILTAMRSFPAERLLQTSACEALSVIIERQAPETHQLLLGDAEAHKAIVKAIKRHSKATNTMHRSACITLTEMVCNSTEIPCQRNLDRFEELDIPKLIVQIMTDGSSAELLALCCSALANMSSLIKYDADVLKLAVAEVLKSMQAFPKSAEVQGFGCQAMGTLIADSEQYKAQIVQDQRHLLVVNAMQDFPQDAIIQMHACGLLVRLAIPPNLEQLRSNSIHQLLFHALKSHPGDWAVQNNACSALVDIQFSDVDKVFRTVLDAMERFPSSSLVQTTCCESLRKLCDQPKKKCVIGSLVLKAGELTIKAMLAYKNRLDVQLVGCQCLSVLLLTTNSIDKKNASVVVNSAMAQHDDEALTTWGRKALAAIEMIAETPLMTIKAHLSPSNFSLLRSTFRSLDGVQIVVSAMREQRANAQLQADCCDFFWEALSDIFIEPQLLAQAKIWQDVITAMKDHPDDARVQYLACALLADLKLDHLDIGEEGLQLAFVALKNHDSASVQEHACDLIADLLGVVDKKEIKEDVLLLVFTAMKSHLDVDKIQVSALEVMSKWGFMGDVSHDVKMEALNLTQSAMKRHRSPEVLANGCNVLHLLMAGGIRDQRIERTKTVIRNGLILYPQNAELQTWGGSFLELESESKLKPDPNLLDSANGFPSSNELSSSATPKDLDPKEKRLIDAMELRRSYDEILILEKECFLLGNKIKSFSSLAETLSGFSFSPETLVESFSDLQHRVILASHTQDDLTDCVRTRDTEVSVLLTKCDRILDVTMQAQCKDLLKHAREVIADQSLISCKCSWCESKFENEDNGSALAMGDVEALFESFRYVYVKELNLGLGMWERLEKNDMALQQTTNEREQIANVLMLQIEEARAKLKALLQQRSCLASAANAKCEKAAKGLSLALKDQGKISNLKLCLKRFLEAQTGWNTLNTQLQELRLEISRCAEEIESQRGKRRVKRKSGQWTEADETLLKLAEDSWMLPSKSSKYKLSIRNQALGIAQYLPEVSASVNTFHGTWAQAYPVHELNEYDWKPLSEGNQDALVAPSLPWPLGAKKEGLSVLRAYSADLSQIRADVHLLAYLQHPHVLPLRGICECSVSFHGYDWFLEFPHIEMNFSQWREEHKDQNRILNVIRQVLEGLNYLHLLGLVHGAITPHNILMNEEHKPILNVNLQRLHFAHGNQHSGVYSAPEQRQGSTCSCSDVYAIGCILYETLMQRPYFEQPGILCTDASLDLLLRAMLHPEPHHRATAAQVLRDPLMKSLLQPPICAMCKQTANPSVGLQCDSDHFTCRLCLSHVSHELPLASTASSTCSRSSSSSFARACPPPLPLPPTCAPPNPCSSISLSSSSSSSPSSSPSSPSAAAVVSLPCSHEKCTSFIPRALVKNVVDFNFMEHFKDVLRDMCPRCGQEFKLTVGDCAALTCARCLFPFCYWCFKEGGRKHVETCPKNLASGRCIFITPERWAETPERWEESQALRLRKFDKIFPLLGMVSVEVEAQVRLLLLQAQLSHISDFCFGSGDCHEHPLFAF